MLKRREESKESAAECFKNSRLDLSGQIRETLNVFAETRSDLEDLCFIVNHLREDSRCAIDSFSGRPLRKLVEQEIADLTFSIGEMNIIHSSEENLEANWTELLDATDCLEETLMEKGVLESLPRSLAEREIEFSKLTNQFQEIIKQQDQQRNELLASSTEAAGKYCEDLQRLDEKSEDMKKQISCLEVSLDECKIAKQATLESLTVTTTEIEELKEKSCEADAKFEQELLTTVAELKRANDEVKEKQILLEDLKAQITEMKQSKAALEEELKQVVTESSEAKKLHQEGMDQQSLSLESLKLEKEDLKVAQETLQDRLKEAIDISVSLQAKLEEAEANHQNQLGTLESVRKMEVVYRIELEKVKDTLARERRINSLKLSDLQEQLDAMKAAQEGSLEIQRESTVSEPTVVDPFREAKEKLAALGQRRDFSPPEIQEAPELVSKENPECLQQ